MDFVKKGKKVTVIGAGNVGASIAFGNQICIGNCADLPHAANITPNNTMVFALGSKCSNAVIEKVPDWLNK